MIKHYSIIAPADICDYNKSEDIFDALLPCWIKKEMRLVASMEGVDMKDLIFERKIFWNRDKARWVDSAEIIKH